MKDTEEPHYQTEMINVVDEVRNIILIVSYCNSFFRVAYSLFAQFVN